ncbi:MAG: hypothetical protein R3308_11170, partial [Thiohalobacterales bacterium]|nr:hypothetical protein [Thiohalobacterales bacterium]
TPVGGEHHGAAPIGTHKTKTSLIFTQLAETRTQITLNTTIIQGVPVSRRNYGAFIPAFFRLCHHRHPVTHHTLEF